MKLTDLDPDWIHDYDLGPPRTYTRSADLSIANAQGIIFLCPKCYAANGGEVGTHSVLVWFRGRGVPDSAEPGATYKPGENPDYPQGRPPARWEATGTGFADLTTKPSIWLKSGCGWHGWITNGEAA
jgi:hypothetical protein